MRAHVPTRQNGLVRQDFATTRCLFGVASRDVTPPVGIHARAWGAATHDVAIGVHRPFRTTAAAIAPIAGDGRPLVLVALDLGWFAHGSDERALRHAVAERAGLDEAHLLINLSHTHAGANVNSALADRPGGELIGPYLDELTRRVGDAVVEACSALEPAWITYGEGRCGLAANRDLWDPDASRFACGYAPATAADDTLLVARVCDDAGGVRATLFNYGCHPTTLAWENRLLSPDFVGAAREVLEVAFDAPALFLQGALGDVAPRDDYVGDPAVADRNGRQLGHAAAAAIEALPPPGTAFAYTGIVASGANLGTWAYEPIGPEQHAASELLEARLTHVPLRRKDELGVVESVSSASPDSVQEREKALRRRFLALELGDGPVHEMPLWTWRLGDALLVALPNETYQVFQTALRERFAGTPLLVLNTTNGGVGYMPPREVYGTGTYQEQQSPFAPGCLEETLEAATRSLEALLDRRPSGP